MAMLQSLLAERFKLAVHREVRIVSGYKLVVAKGGLKAPASWWTRRMSRGGLM